MSRWKDVRQWDHMALFRQVGFHNINANVKGRGSSNNREVVRNGPCVDDVSDVCVGSIIRLREGFRQTETTQEEVWMVAKVFYRGSPDQIMKTGVPKALMGNSVKETITIPTDLNISQITECQALT